jgi:Mn-dependent DtxR family transcriptional regulator
MRSAVTVAESVADDELLQRLFGALKKANGGPLMVREIAGAMGVSLTTAGKYVDIAKAMGLVQVKPYASAKQVTLSNSTGKGGVGVR